MNTSLMHPAALSHMGANKPEEMCILRSHHDDRDDNGDDRNDHDDNGDDRNDDEDEAKN